MNGAPFTSGSTISADGIYTLVVTDAAGNVTTVPFTIDKTPPNVTGITYGGSNNHDVIPQFDEGTAILNGEPLVSGTTISTRGEYTLVVTDTMGNATTVWFTIDKPIIIVEPTQDLVVGGQYAVMNLKVKNAVNLYGGDIELRFNPRWFRLII